MSSTLCFTVWVLTSALASIKYSHNSSEWKQCINFSYIFIILWKTFWMAWIFFFFCIQMKWLKEFHCFSDYIPKVDLWLFRWFGQLFQEILKRNNLIKSVKGAVAYLHISQKKKNNEAVRMRYQGLFISSQTLNEDKKLNNKISEWETTKTTVLHILLCVSKSSSKAKLFDYSFLHEPFSPQSTSLFPSHQRSADVSERQSSKLRLLLWD